MCTKKAAVLSLADGTKFEGFSFGADGSVSGEVVFNTAMLGYPELLSAPASKGQILVLTYPLIGNYGVPPRDVEDGLLRNYESNEMQISGLVVTDYSEEYSHWNVAGSLAGWLRESGVPAICGVDTRELAKHLREHGEMAGRIVIEGADEKKEPATEAGAREPKSYGSGSKTVCVVGDNIANTVIRSLVRRGVKVVADPAGVTDATVDGVLVTGTAGDPKKATGAIGMVKKAIAAGKPVFGVCGGDTLLALAAGGSVVRLPRGHRGANQSVLETGTDHAQITAQNHGWAVDAASLPGEWKVWFTNLNDGSVEGIRHSSKPFGAVAFHPEATQTPEEADPLYNSFIETVRKQK
jgi:carbamoyl-phosphate synthase small subunit